jgi:coproporphyrinogen III oxidase
MDIDKIYSEIRNCAAGEIEKIDGKKEWLRNTWTPEIGTFDISLFRGTALEKASIARVSLDVKKAAGSSGETFTSMHVDGLQVNIYPAHPLLPVALLNLERRQLASGIRLGGYISIFPMNGNEEMTGRIKEAFSSIVKSMGQSTQQALKDYGEMWRELDWPFKGEKGIGIKISGDGTNLDTMKTAVVSMLKNFLKTVAEKKDVRFSEEDEKNMFSFRFKLSEFILVKDLSTKISIEKGVQLETLSSMILPPVVKF